MQIIIYVTLPVCHGRKPKAMSSTFEEYNDRCPPSSHFWAFNEWSVAFSQGSAAAFPRRKKHKPI